MKSSIRRLLNGLALGWTVSAAFFTPPVKTFEVVVIIILLAAIFVLDIADTR